MSPEPAGEEKYAEEMRRARRLLRLLMQQLRDRRRPGRRVLYFEPEREELNAAEP